MKNIVTTKVSIHILKEPEIVWDFTQSFEKRTLWDKSILRAKVIQELPTRIVDIETRGNVKTKLHYKQESMPHKTSLYMVDTKSLLIKGGGGSWKYERENNGTLWTQTNTLILKNRFVYILFGKLITFLFAKSTEASMKRAKMMIEDYS